MKKNFIEFLLSWPRSYISGTDLSCFLNKSSNARQAIIKRAIKAGYLTPLRRDLFLVKSLQKKLVNAFEIAMILHGPSYISFESALSYHGWIPEAVQTTTCATTKKSKEFETPIGIFSYTHVPLKVFALCVEQHFEKNMGFFIASPLKALADMIYIRNRDWSTINDLYEDLRIEPDKLQSIDKESFLNLIQHYPSTRVKTILTLLLKEIYP